MTEFAVARQRRRKPGNLARRLGFALRAALWTLGGLLAAAYLLIFVSPLPAPPKEPEFAESTKVFDRNGRLLYDSAAGRDAHYTYVPLDEISERLKQAVIATEDERFFSHHGIEPLAISRAAAQDLTHLEFQSGGSTITQQLARNLYFSPEERFSRSPVRKLRESLLALQLERARTKDEILETYLNRVYFGNLAYGVEAASRTYFGKSARDLDVAEASLLGGLLQSPGAYDPFRNFEAAKTRQSTVLRLMVEAGYVSQEEAAAAWLEPLRLTDTPFSLHAPHFVAWVLDQVNATLCDEVVAKGGLRVYTSLDLNLQNAAQGSLSWHVSNLREKQVTNGAVVAIDPLNGDVLAMVGSADYFDESIAGAVNVALAERQPGSSIKPVVYAAALERGYTPATPLLDVPTSVVTKQGEVYSPNNYDLAFHGVVPLREALASSYNVPAVRLLETIGVEEAVRLGARLGLSSLRDPADYDLSLTLGGGEVRLLDLTAAYAAFASGGLGVEPRGVLRIEDAKGHVLYAAPSINRERVLSAQTAYLISDILSDNAARAPSFGSESVLKLDRPAAVKTGTTTDFRDNWTVGYTQDLAVGVWVGNSDGTPMRGVSGIDGAAPVWRDVILAGLRNVPPRPFEAPNGIERAEVCLPSGLRPTPDCRRTRLEVFAEGTAPQTKDDYYGAVRTCSGSAAEPCASMEERVYAFPPLEALPWASQAGLEVAPPSLYGGNRPGGASEPGLRLISPVDGVVIKLSRDLAGSDQIVRLEAQPAQAVAFVEFSVDGRVAGRVDAPPFRLNLALRPGNHEARARAVDSSGNDLASNAARFQVLEP